MKHVSIFGKFFLLMATFGLTALALTLYQSRQTSEISRSYEALLERDAFAALNLSQSNRSLEAARASISDMMMTRSNEARARAEAGLKDAQENFVKFMDLAIAAVPREREFTQLKSDGFSLLTDACGAAIALGRGATSEAKIATVQQLFLTLCQPAIAAISPRFTALTGKMAADAERKRAEVSATVHDTSVMALGAAVIALIAVSSFGFLATQSCLVQPIKQIAETMKMIASGDLASTIEGTDRRDEIGAMAKAVQVFRDNELRTRELEKDMEASRGASELERARAAQTERQRAQEMVEATSNLAEGLKHLASGNLTFRLDERFTSDFEGLRTDFNIAGGQLANSLATVAAATAAIDAGASEISQSATDLSRRTEQQAASLQGTAAALDQITRKISSSSRRTEEARHAAMEANGSARNSGEVMARAISAMQGIEQASNRISSIIGVIDEIAFQTNLLALNAGVEASRAGEAGKGFAVVAQEVRDLAQRSARAAKEIKDLIRNSMKEVSAGAKLVQDTGRTLKTIEEQVAVINRQLDGIAISANEQSVALAEVNSAVSHMDQVTQQNASMAERCTSASTSLAAEVKRLREAVSQFRLEPAQDLSNDSRSDTAGTDSTRGSPVRRIMAKVVDALGMPNNVAEC